MILIITHKKDYTADFLINKLNIKSIPYLRLNCEDLLSDPQYAISNSNSFEIIFENDTAIKTVWLRRTQMPNVNLPLEEKLYLNNEFKSLLENIYCSLEDKKWISNPFSIYKAENKILQLKSAFEIGFNIPKTLITNSKEKLLEFHKANENTIIKPLHSGYVTKNGIEQLFFTNILTDKHISSLKDSDLSPCIFQEYIEKEYELRITIVNNKVFAAKVESQKNNNSKVDWRREKQVFESYSIPKALESRCISLCKKLNLNFGAIDMIKNKNGEYTFLEINPNGQWAWIEMETNLPISEEIIKFLDN